jgi:hypothetical protein
MLQKKKTYKKLLSLGLFSALFCFSGSAYMVGDDELSDDEWFAKIQAEEVPPIPTFRSPVVDDFSFWQRSYGARSRDPLFLIPTRRLIFEKDGFHSTFFFNMSDRLTVYPELVFNIDSLDLFNDLAGGATSFTEGEAGSFETLFKAIPYIRKMTVEERRLGFMLNGGFSKNKFSFQCDLPLILAERNYWIPNKSERRSLQELLDKIKKVSKGGAYKVRYGLGDTRLKFGYNFADNNKFKSAAGLSFILPTSKIFSKKPRDIIKSKPGASRNELVGDLLNVQATGDSVHFGSLA